MLFEHEFIFEKVENRLDERAFTQKIFFSKDIRTFFMCALNTHVDFQSLGKQAQKSSIPYPKTRTRMN